MNIDRSKRWWLVGLAACLSWAGFIGGCGSDEESDPTEVTESTPIEVQSIIASPKAGTPGDTLLFSAIIVSSSPNVGDIPHVEWTATDNGVPVPNAFLENDFTSVRWVAPPGGVYRISARATNAVSSDTGTLDVVVAPDATLASGNGGAIHLGNGPPDFFYLRTGADINDGADVYSVVGSVGTDAVDMPIASPGVNARTFAYAPNATFEVHAVDSIAIGSLTPPIHLYLGDFATKTYRRISAGVPNALRFPQFVDPDVAPDNRSIAYGAMFPQVDVANADTFHVVVYDRVTPSRIDVNATHTNHRNAFPTWSTDHRWLTFVSDRNTRNLWELYGLPVTGGVVNTSQASLVRLTNTGGTLASGNIGSPSFVKPRMSWNPELSTLALITTDNTLYLVTTTPTGATQRTVAAGVMETAWSANGEWLALTSTEWVASVNRDGSAFDYRVGIDDEGEPTRPGDTFADLAWSPDGRWLVYRVTRGSMAWFEALDTNGSSVPLPITAADPDGSLAWGLADYRGLMSMSPAWSASNVLYYATFGTGSPTVGVRSLDLSTLIP